MMQQALMLLSVIHKSGGLTSLIFIVIFYFYTKCLTSLINVKKYSGLNLTENNNNYNNYNNISSDRRIE